MAKLASLAYLAGETIFCENCCHTFVSVCNLNTYHLKKNRPKLEKINTYLIEKRPHRKYESLKNKKVMLWKINDVGNAVQNVQKVKSK